MDVGLFSIFKTVGIPTVVSLCCGRSGLSFKYLWIDLKQRVRMMDLLMERTVDECWRTS